MHIFSPETDNCLLVSVEGRAPRKNVVDLGGGWTRDLLVSSRSAHPTEPPRPHSYVCYKEAYINFIRIVHYFIFAKKDSSRSTLTNVYPADTRYRPPKLNGTFANVLECPQMLGFTERTPPYICLASLLTQMSRPGWDVCVKRAVLSLCSLVHSVFVLGWGSYARARI